jgi:hypothetical protein
MTLSKFKEKYGYEPPAILVRIYTIRNQLIPLFHNYLIDIKYLQNFLCRFIKKYCYLERKIEHDKINVEVEAYEGPIKLIHESFGNTINLNRLRMDSVTKEFEQQLMLGLEYMSCWETEEENTDPKF